MRILFIGFPASVHTARWINQLSGLGWDIHLAPSNNTELHSLLSDEVTYHGPGKVMFEMRKARKKLLQRWPNWRGSGLVHRLLEDIDSGMSIQRLVAIIRKVQPDIVHSLEIQHAGYRTLAAKQVMGDAFPTWMVGNWGSDVYLFGRLAKHRDRVKEVLSTCDYVTCECARDVRLVREYGFQGADLPVIPAAGGWDLAGLQPLRRPGPTSSRRVILLKGYQHWAGRALAGLRAIELCADVLQGYRVLIQLTTSDVEMAAELVAQSTGIPIDIVKLFGHPIHSSSDYAAVMRRYGQARIHIGLSISDGISQSLLEAMVMGAFPIQSCTACADEWIEDGKSGLIVPPEDPHIIAAAIRRAVTDDELVDRAVAINDETVRRRLDYDPIKQQVIGLYQSVYDAQTRTRAARS